MNLMVGLKNLNRDRFSLYTYKLMLLEDSVLVNKNLLPFQAGLNKLCVFPDVQGIGTELGLAPLSSTQLKYANLKVDYSPSPASFQSKKSRPRRTTKTVEGPPPRPIRQSYLHTVLSRLRKNSSQRLLLTY